MLKINFKKGIILMEESDIPKLESIDFESVILKVKYSGLCGSDMHRIRDSLNKMTSMCTLGHEIVGEVLQSNDSRFSKGDFAVVMPIGFCGKCNNCKNGKTQFCNNSINIGKNTDGGFSELLKIPSKLLYKINSLNKNYVLTDSLACIMHAENLIGKIKNKKIGILGDGAISELAVRYFSIENEVINFVKNIEETTDKYAKRIKTDNATNQNNFQNYFDLVFECVGGKNKNLINFSGEILNFNGTLLILGVYDKDFYTEIHLRDLFYKEIIILGSNSFIVTEKVDEFGSAVNFISDNLELFSGIITHVLPLTQFNKALEIFNNKNTTNAKKIIFA